MGGVLGIILSGGPNLPGIPTIGTATKGNGQATVTFTAPSWDGGSAITSYTVVSSPGGVTATGSSSPITISGLSNGTPYTFTVYATNSVGNGSASGSSNQITPSAPIVASGGGTIYDGTGAFAGYRFHVFNSPGTFSVSSNPGGFSFSILAVGGGGRNAPPAAPSGSPAGGGGGSVNEFTGVGLTTGSTYNIHINAGGADGSATWLGPSGTPIPSSTGTYNAPKGGDGGSTPGGGGHAGGVSGNGNPGGVPGAGAPSNPRGFWGGGGGGGAGGTGNAGYKSIVPFSPQFTPSTVDPAPAPSPAPGKGGDGGAGFTSTIDGITYGSGGGGGSSVATWPGPGQPLIDQPLYGLGGSSGGNNGAASAGTGSAAGSTSSFMYGAGAGGNATTANPGGNPGAGNVPGTGGLLVVRYPYP